jgi:outer membrane autotransporter protein
MQGGSLTLSDSLMVNGNTVMPGSSICCFRVGGNGQALGSGFFLQGNGTLVFAPGVGQTQIVSDVISDQNGNGGTVANGTEGIWGLTKLSAGTLVLGNSGNSFTGGVAVAGGALSIAADGALGIGGTLTLGDGATLALTAGGNYSHALTVAGNPTIAVDVGQRANWSGPITGAGGLTKLGPGILTLSGTSTYVGSTTISAGTLRAKAGGTFSATSAFAVASSATLDLNGFDQTIGSLSGSGAVTLGTGKLTTGGDNSSTTFSGVISGGGGLVKTGRGTFVLTGANTYAGTTSITGGILEVGDANNPAASLGGDVTVGPFGRLAGHGTIGGSVSNMTGAVVPGGSIGTLRIGGNYTQGSAGTLAIEVSPTGASQLTVGGKAGLAGTLALVYDPGTYSAKTYTLVQAASVSGSFGAVTGQVPTPGLTQSVIIDPIDVQLALTSAPATLVVAPTNDTIFPAMTSALILSGQRANLMVLARLGSRLRGISDAPTIASPAASVPRRLAPNGSSNLAAVGEIAGTLPAAIAQYGGWFRGIGSFASLNGNGTAPGFGANSGGFLVGFDRPVGPDLYFGAAAGYIHTDVQEHSTSSGDTGTGRFIVYGGGWAGPALWTAAAGYAHDRIDTTRGFAGVGTAQEAHGGDELTAGVQGSLPMVVNGTTVTPKVGLPYLHLHERAFGETGANGLDLSSGARNTNSLQPYLAVSVAQTLVMPGGAQLTPELRLGYSREVLSNSRALTVATLDGSDFLVQGVNPSKDMLTGGVGVTVRARDDVFLYANYNALARTGNTAVQTVSAGLRVRF